MICQVLRPQLKADTSAWIQGLSEAVSSAPPQHQWSALRSLWAAIDPVLVRPLPSIVDDQGLRPDS
eukprot:12547297-Prorocentrum_lima.AAC.1